ncbi:hypothetical protein ACRCUN_29000 [Mycobacterium sp. LTG2003]
MSDGVALVGLLTLALITGWAILFGRRMARAQEAADDLSPSSTGDRMQCSGRYERERDNPNVLPQRHVR